VMPERFAVKHLVSPFISSSLLIYAAFIFAGTDGADAAGEKGARPSSSAKLLILIDDHHRRFTQRNAFPIMPPTPASVQPAPDD
jgi:hypothetical protein